MHGNELAKKKQKTENKKQHMVTKNDCFFLKKNFKSFGCTNSKVNNIHALKNNF